MNSVDKAAHHLADNIADLRRRKNFSQKQLADLAGVPRTTLTNIESGLGNPSLQNLVKISAALNVGIEELLSRPRSDCQIVSAEQVPVQNRSGGRVRVHELLPDKIKGIGIERLEFDPEAIMGGHPHLNGTKEYLHVLKGEIVVHVAGEAFTVKKGDVLAFPGNQPHSYRNSKKTPAVAISVVIPVPASV